MTAEAQFPVRLYWCHWRGLARAGGHEVKLSSPPLLAGQAFDVVDYVPGVVAQVLPRQEGWREMTQAEIDAARRLLWLMDDEICSVDACTGRVLTVGGLPL